MATSQLELLVSDLPLTLQIDLAQSLDVPSSSNWELLAETLGSTAQYTRVSELKATFVSILPFCYLESFPVPFSCDLGLS